MKTTEEQYEYIITKFPLVHIQRQLVKETIDLLKADKNRYYHSFDYHIFPMIEEVGCEEHLWAALFHDFIYDIKNGPGVNEKESEKVWLVSARAAKINPIIIEGVSKCILATYGHKKTGSTLVDTFLKLDLSSFTKTFDKVLEDELMVRKEYASIDWQLYKEGRIAFLEKFADNELIVEMGVSHVLKLQAEYLKFHTPKIAIYPGSFNPIHIGHWDIWKKASCIFDKVILVYAQNSEKEASVPKIPSCLSNVQVEFVEGSIIEWVNKLPYPVTIIRGLRNSTDVNYEQNYLFWLKELADDKDLKVVSIFCDKELEHISSSALKVVKMLQPGKYDKYILH